MEKVFLSQLLKGICTPCQDCVVSSVEVDSRNIKENSIFLAIKGERVNGQDYAKAALEKGACFVLTEDYIEDIEQSKQCVVENILDTSIKLGENYRDLFDITVIGVTGSVGKTSTKDFIYSAVSPFAKTVRSLGNHNNEIGMPQTIFTFTKEDKYAVLEMGMSDFNDVHKLSAAAKPKYAAVTCIGVSHLEKMKTKENILKAKLEICDGMDKEGTLVLNGDDDLLIKAQIKNPVNVKYFAIDNKNADTVAENINTDGYFTSFAINDKKYGVFQCKIPAVGKHNVMNALCAYTVAVSMGFEPEKVCANLSGYVPSGMRQKIVKKDGVTYIEDCYNASPDSMRAAVNTLNTLEGKRKICVFGDMLELGENSPKMHFDTGAYAKEKGVDIMLCFGQMAKNISKGFGENALDFETKEKLADYLKDILQTGDCVVFKASRGMKFEEIIQMMY